MAGRPTKFKDEFIELAENYSLLGATDEEMRGFFKVSRSTFSKWMAENTEFSDTVNRHKAAPDGRVAAKLFQRAMGYEITETKTEGIAGTGEDSGKVVGKRVTKTVKQIAPDVAAQIFWLKNRQRDKWKDRWITAEDDVDMESPPLRIEFSVRPAVAEVEVTNANTDA